MKLSKKSKNKIQDSISDQIMELRVSVSMSGKSMDSKQMDTMLYNLEVIITSKVEKILNS